jgi:hypothetical protein
VRVNSNLLAFSLKTESKLGASLARGRVDLTPVVEAAYSVRRDFTGLLTAALIAWNEIVKSEMPTAAKPAMRNISASMVIAY